MPDIHHWDDEFDVVVVGSGAGGMTGAITAHACGLSTVVIEKAKRFGGSTSISGGGIWIPNNAALKASGQIDDPERVLTYLASITNGAVPEDKIAAYVAHGPAAMELLGRHRWWKYRWIKGYADYHPENPGGAPLGRSVEPLPFDTRKLGEDEKRMYPNAMVGPMGVWVTQRDYHDLAMVKRTWRGRRAALVAAWRVASNMVRRRHMATGGRALSARLRMIMKDAGIPLWLRARFVDLIIEDDTVVGIMVHRDGDAVAIRARRGVLLAAGGFEHNQRMREDYLPAGARVDASLGVRDNTGDAIAAGQAAGAAVDLMDDAWWMPSIQHPMGVPIPLVSERAIPGQIIVAGDGMRFTNEASPYVNFVHDQLAGKYVPAWMIMDSRARRRYPFAQILPGKTFPPEFFAKGVVHTAHSIAALAEKITVPQAALTATIERFNAFAATGVDLDFHRGESAHDRYYGDPTLKNPNLARIDRAPFFAVRIEVGDLGTKGGLVTDAHGRVLRADGSALAGLYATGNTSASMMGNDYAGPGATIGPAIVFGYLAAMNAAGRTPGA
jgi:3-oxosteroid 1-dehydrogenase